MEGPGAPPGHGEGPGLSGGAPARVVREGLLQDPRRAGDGHAEGDHHAPTASWPASSTPTPTPVTPPPRSASRRSRPPTTSSATRPSARSTTRSARLGPMRRDGLRRRPAAAPAGSAAPAPAASTSRAPTSATCSATCSAAAVVGAVAAGGRPGHRPAARRRPRGRAAPVVPRGACAGVTTSVHLTSDMPCRTCHGTGAAPGHQPRRPARTAAAAACSTTTRASSRSATPCPACGGRGHRSSTDPCPTCRGTGIERRPREVKVRIPAGVDDGQRIRLKGRGGPGRNGGPAGDLYVRRPRRAATPLFGRDGDNLTLTVPVTFAEAALGTRLTVPTLDGEPVTLKIPAGTPSGKVFRVKGRGRRGQEGPRRPARHRRGRGADRAHRRAARRPSRRWPRRSPPSPRAHLGV